MLLDDGRAAVLWPRVPAVPHTTLFRRELGEQIGWFDPEFRYACSDADFLARLGELGPIAYVREVVSWYRRGHGALWADDIRTSCSRIQLWEKHLARIGGRDPALTARLHERLLGAALVLERHRQSTNGAPTGDLDVAGFIGRALSLLPVRQRLSYELRARVKIPLRRLLIGAPA